MTMILTLVSCLFLAPASPPLPASVDRAEVPGYVVAAPGVAAGGTPTARGRELLKAAGVATLVDLRTAKEVGDAEQRAKAEGFRYVSVPVTPATLSAQDVEAVARALADPAAGTVYLQCASGNRSGGMWALLRSRAGASRAEALADGERVGMRSASLRAAVERLLPTP